MYINIIIIIICLSLLCIVTSHVQYLKALNDGAPLLLSPSPNQLPLTKLLVLLDETGGGRVFNDDHSVIINEVTDLYNHCRYSQEVRGVVMGVTCY